MAQYEIEKARAAIAAAVAEAVSEEYDLKFPAEDAVLEVPKDRKLGDFAFAMQGAARRTKEAPPDAATHLAARLQDEVIPVIGKVEHSGPYVNFRLSDKFYADAVNQALLLKTAFGSTDIGKGKTALVEYSGPNTGKPMHVGHIRSTILGDAAVRLLKSQGFKAFGMNYIGDSGAHVAELLVALQEFKDLPQVNNEVDLLQYYVKIKQQIDTSPELKKRAEELGIAFERGDLGVAKQIKLIWDLSWPAFQRNYDTLEVRFDEVIGESRLVQDALRTVQECIKKGVARKQPDGSVISDLEKHGIANKVVLRANGTTLYFTRDLALADYKWSRYKFDASYVFTAAEQNLHFKQLQKVLELLGRPFFARYKHVGFGLISLPEGKFSTREGRVVLLEDVLAKTIAIALAELEKRQADEKSVAARSLTSQYSQEDFNRIAYEVGIGSVKFAVLRIAPEKNIAFDPDKVVSFEGDTGAYVQYSAVRCKKIIAKADHGRITTLSPRQFNEFEKKLAFTIARYPEVLASAARNVQPHVLCDYLLELAAAFSSFYENCPVLQAPDEKVKVSRLGIVKAALNVFENALGTLNIRVPENM